jgi:2-oxoglutarate dehydrogenase E2 component (dihydrolipoamide succinyltransferase)
MSDSVQMPALGESVTEGTVTRWLKQIGDRVEVDEPLLEVSTDKVDTEIPSPVAGVLEQILVSEDEDGRDRRATGADRGRLRCWSSAGREPTRRDVVGPGAGSIGGSPGSGGARPRTARSRGTRPPPAAPARPPLTRPQWPPPRLLRAVGSGVLGLLGRRRNHRDHARPRRERPPEGTVTRWLKQQGEKVEVDEPLLEVSTRQGRHRDPLAGGPGSFSTILVAEDETVEVGAPLAIVGGPRPPQARLPPLPHPRLPPRRPRRPSPSRRQSRLPPATGHLPLLLPLPARQPQAAPRPAAPPAPQPAASSSSHRCPDR